MKVNEIITHLKQHLKLDSKLKSFELEPVVDKKPIFSFLLTENRVKYSFSFISQKEYTYDGIGVFINFLDIEQILVPILKKHAILGESANYSTTSTIGLGAHNSFFPNENFDELKNNFNVQVKSPNDIDVLVENINQIWKELVNPFFDYWKSITDFIPLFENSDEMTLIRNLGIHIRYKKMIIWKLCNHPDFLAFINDAIAKIENGIKAKPNEQFYHQHYNALKELKDTLETTEPLYEWDERFKLK